jgi:purine-binding chemotaxis protein CheW
MDDKQLSSRLADDILSTKANDVCHRRSDEIQVVEFLLGEKTFAIDLFDTKEVINQPEITPLPDAPHYVEGIIDLRGIITTILDLKSLMNIGGEAKHERKSRVIVLDADISHKIIGVLVDDVLSVTTYNESVVDRDHNSERARNRLGVIRKKAKDSGEKEAADLVILVDIHGIVKRIEETL